MRTATAVLRWALVAAPIVLALSLSHAKAQGRVSGASTETRRIAQPLDREIQALAGRGSDLWVAYRMQAIPTARQLCGGSHVVLEPSSTSITIMAKIEGRALRRLRVFTPECDVDAGNVPLVWLEAVAPDDSASWLVGLVRSNHADRDWQTRVGDPAVTALTLQVGDVALRSLIALARDDSQSVVRSRALLSLAQRAGEQAARAITDTIERDPELEVKKTAVLALSRLPKDEGVPLLIQVARDSRNAAVRREAMLRLGQTNDPRAVRFFEEILTKQD